MHYARRFGRGIPSAAGLLLCAILMASAGSAESVLDSVPAIENISRRLELTAEQEAQLRPIFQSRLSEIQATQRQVQQAATPQEQEEVLRAAKVAADAFNAQVERVLSPAQRSEWREIRSETREKVKERAEERRESE